MPGGRPPKPTAALKLHGGLRQGRHDDREREVQPGGGPECMAKLSGEAKKLWGHHVPMLTELGLATQADSCELTAMCEWWQRYRQWQDMEGEVNEYRRMTAMVATWKQFDGIARKFGMSARDRVGLESSRPTERDEIEDIISG